MTLDVFYGKDVLMIITPEFLKTQVLFRDSFVLVLNKPSGIAVHGGTKGGVTLMDYMQHFTYGLPDIPQLAHRLDRETSGCLVFGRNKKALGKLGKLFETQKAKKTYHAVCLGTPPKLNGIIDAPLARKSHDTRSWHMKVDAEHGQAAVTHYKVLKQTAEYCVLELKPKTGRTHQLRVHLASIGCPIAGDGLYGGDVARNFASRLMLHAKYIELPLYHNKAPLLIEAPYPKEIECFVNQNP